MSQRPVLKSQYEDGQNQGNQSIPKEAWIHSRPSSVHSADDLSVPRYVSVGLLLFKGANKAAYFEKLLFDDSMGTEYQIFMIALPKMEVYSLILQRNHF